jgi:quercetin dioxygenase-like cupin family protein
MPVKVRRVVTGHDENGKAKVVKDSRLEGLHGRKGFQHTLVWATDSLPPVLTEDDPASWEIGTTISNGSVFRIIQYDPGVAERWHATDSIDYAIILSGEIDMQLDEGEVHLSAGDVLVQRATIHNWVNRGNAPCVIAFVLIATEGGKATGWR